MIDKLSYWFIGTAHAANFDAGQFFTNSAFTVSSNVSSGTAQSQLTTTISLIITWLLAIVAIIAFIYMIINGIKYITAGGDAAKATEARQGVVNAIIGIVIVVAAYFLVSFAFSLGSTLVKGS